MLNALGRFNISRYLFHEICFLNAHYYLLSQQITFYISVCRLTKKVHQEKNEVCLRLNSYQYRIGIVNDGTFRINSCSRKESLKICEGEYCPEYYC